MTVTEQTSGESIAQPALVNDQQLEQISPTESIERRYPDSSSSTLELPIPPITKAETKLQSSGAVDSLQLAESADVRTTDHRSKLLDLEKSQGVFNESAEEIKSIAAQVDEVLQEKLASSSLKNQAIRLMELPTGGMVVMVNNDQFDGVNEVPDPEIRNLIQESVAEWERRLDLE
jgi:hypothetical protein